jgi:5-methylcytosine-specific restriction endonuclease McrA
MLRIGTWWPADKDDFAMTEVLLLNQNYEPLNVCDVRRALTLLMREKADVLHHHEAPVITASGNLQAPSVLKMRYMVKRPMPQLRLSRHSILARDQFTCQYCGVKAKDLTIDHVIPKWAGGPQTWDNLVACCRRCNLKKGDKTPKQANMSLKRHPRRPNFIPYLALPTYLRARHRDEWSVYLPIFDEFAMEQTLN